MLQYAQHFPFYYRLVSNKLAWSLLEDTRRTWWTINELIKMRTTITTTPKESSSSSSTHMLMKTSTLSSLKITPDWTSPLHMRTPITGMMTSLPMVIHKIAPTGNVRHWFKGTFRRARDDPRHIRPMGIDAAPMNVAMSCINASGGWPSGAGGIWTLGTWTKSALSWGTRDIGRHRQMVIDIGLRKPFMKPRACFVKRR